MDGVGAAAPLPSTTTSVSASALVLRLSSTEQKLRIAHQTNDRLLQERSSLMYCLERLVLLSSCFAADVREELARAPGSSNSNRDDIDANDDTVLSSMKGRIHPPLVQKFLSSIDTRTSAVADEKTQAAIDATEHIEEVMKSLQPFLLRCVQTASSVAAQSQQASSNPPSRSVSPPTVATRNEPQLSDDDLKEVWEAIEYHHRLKLVSRMWGSLLRSWRDSFFAIANAADHSSRNEWIPSRDNTLDGHFLSPISVFTGGSSTESARVFSVPPALMTATVGSSMRRLSPLRAEDVAGDVDVPLAPEAVNDSMDDVASSVSTITTASSSGGPNNAPAPSQQQPQRMRSWGFDVAEVRDVHDTISMMELPSLRIVYVYEHTCADAAGLRPGDTLIAVNEHRTTTHLELSAVMGEIEQQPAHTQVHVTVLRSGKVVDVFFDPEGLGSRLRDSVPSLMEPRATPQGMYDASHNSFGGSPQRTPVRRDLLGSYPVSGMSPRRASPMKTFETVKSSIISTGHHVVGGGTAMVGKLNQTLERLKEIQKRREELLLTRLHRNHDDSSSIASVSSSCLHPLRSTVGPSTPRSRLSSPQKTSPSRGRPSELQRRGSGGSAVSSSEVRSRLSSPKPAFERGVASTMPSITSPLRQLTPSPTRKAVWR